MITSSYDIFFLGDAWQTTFVTTDALC